MPLVSYGTNSYSYVFHRWILLLELLEDWMTWSQRESSIYLKLDFWFWMKLYVEN